MQALVLVPDTGVVRGVVMTASRPPKLRDFVYATTFSIRLSLLPVTPGESPIQAVSV